MTVPDHTFEPLKNLLHQTEHPHMGKRRAAPPAYDLQREGPVQSVGCIVPLIRFAAALVGNAPEKPLARPRPVSFPSSRDSSA